MKKAKTAAVRKKKELSTSLFPKIERRMLAVNAGLLTRAVSLLVDFLLLRFTIAIPFVKKVLSFYEQAGITVYEANSSINSSEVFNISRAYFEAHPEILNQLYLWFIGMFAAFWLYFSLMEFFFGQTFGKMLVKLAVIRDERPSVKDARALRPSILQCLLKNIRWIPFLPLIMLWPIDLLFVIFRKDKRSLSEVMSGTKTVQYVEY